VNFRSGRNSLNPSTDETRVRRSSAVALEEDSPCRGAASFFNDPEFPNQILASLGTDHPLDLRNRALVYAAYGSGLRVSEAVKLRIADYTELEP